MPIEINAQSASPPEPARRSFWQALGRGLVRRCPSCGQGRIFAGYLKVQPHCQSCGLELGSFRSDDAPPYFTIFIVGHVVLPLVLMLERAATPPIWLQIAFWVPLTLAMTLVLLPRVKGAVIGVQWATRATI